MNAMTPTLTEQRNILEFLADPERPKQLLDLMKQAEAAEAKAKEAQAAAQVVLDANTAALAKERELQDINARKSAALRDQANELAEREKAHLAAKADDVQRLGEWEQRLKAQADAQATMQAEIDRQVNEVAAARAKLDKDLADAEAIFARAQSIKDAMG